MKITCISDMHGEYPETKGGDLLLLAGDYTGNDKIPQWDTFYKWLHKQAYRKKVMIAGNHDGFLTHCITSAEYREQLGAWDEDVEYLCDSGTEFEGLKIWGSPWSLWFSKINPACTHFTGSEKELDNKFSLIPSDTNILITHTPPYGLADYFYEWPDSSVYHAGSKALLNHLPKLNNLKLHVFGHIHERHGRYEEKTLKHTKISINAAYMNSSYNPTNPPVEIEL